MPQIDKHAPGAFCWVELYTSDQNAAKQFYTSLFGWDFNDTPLGPDSYYTIFKLAGREAAAGFTMRDDPPHWNLYIAVESADATAARATELGGKVLMPPFDVMEAGRMAGIQDPTGAVFFVWQPKKNPGIGVVNEQGAYCWADLSTADRTGAKRFYEQLFGWRISPGQGKDESTYLHITNGEQPIAGIRSDEERNPHVPPHWLPYFMVASVDDSTAKATELGASVLAPPHTIEKTLRLSVVSDPQGAVFALITFN